MTSFLFVNNIRASGRSNKLKAFKDSDFVIEDINAIKQPGNQVEEDSAETQSEDAVKDFRYWQIRKHLKKIKQ